MRTLIVEDDFTSRLLLKKLLKNYGTSDLAVNGAEGVEAVRAALEAGEPYDLICLDIMMPEMDGHEALTRIRQLEAEMGFDGPRRAKIVMTTALADAGNVVKARAQCDQYLAKPIHPSKFLETLRKLALIE
jgi:two-component system chemotaxis response regulator CheY